MCPIRCELFLIMGPVRSTYPPEIITSWNPVNGDFTIMTGDKKLHRQYKFFQVTCVSTLSKIAKPVSAPLALSFLDECASAIVVPPRLNSFYTSLWVEVTTVHPPARVMDMYGKPLNCGEISTKLLGVEPDLYPDVTYSAETSEVTVYGHQRPKHVDEFPLVLESCITLAGTSYGCRQS